MAGGVREASLSRGETSMLNLGSHREAPMQALVDETH
jgi:hypothetical protein